MRPQWSLAEAKPQRFSLIVCYRGLHCPICTTYVAELNKMVPEFTARGVETIAISSDTEARAREAQAKWGLSQLTVGHSLTIGTARTWGLYISSGRGVTSTGVEEPPLFSEPGVFVVRADRTLHTVLDLGAVDAVRATAFSGDPRGVRLRYCQGLSSAGRSVTYECALVNRSLPFVLATLLALSSAAFDADGLVAVKSPFAAKETMDRFEENAKQRGLTVFARIDHAAGAAKSGKTLRSTEVLIFDLGKNAARIRAYLRRLQP